MPTRLILLIFPQGKAFKINQNANRLPAKQILISVAHKKEHFCRIKIPPNLSKFVQYFPEKSSEKNYNWHQTKGTASCHRKNATANAMCP